MTKNKVVYIHRKKTNMEIFYVGIGNINRPYQKGIKDRNKFWHNTVNKYGYVIEIIRTKLSKKEAFDIEKDLIELIGRKDIGLGTLVNLTNGGENSAINGYKVYNIKTGVVYKSIFDAAKDVSYHVSTITQQLNGRSKLDLNMPIRMFNNPYPEDALPKNTIYLSEVDNIETINGFSYMPYYPDDNQKNILDKFNQINELDKDLIRESYDRSLREIQKIYPTFNFMYIHRRISKSIKNILGDRYVEYNNTRRK